MDDPSLTSDTHRMSFGDHLEELRGCLLRALVGLVLCAIVSLFFGKELLAIIFMPLLIVQHANGLEPQLQALAPTAGFVAYLKIGLLAGAIVAMPWILYQAWSFVAAGLYDKEKRFALQMIPGSVALFVTGVIFLYFVVLPIVLNFFIMFNRSFPVDDVTQSPYYKWFAEENESSNFLPADTPLGTLPILQDDPENPTDGSAWINGPQRRLKICVGDGVLITALHPETTSSALQSQFAIDFYISFVLRLALAFGLAFETPIVVFFLAWSRIVSTAVMGRGRKYVLLGIVFAAAVLTPPDVISQLLLAGPMYLLFELGLFVGKIAELKRPAE